MVLVYNVAGLQSLAYSYRVLIAICEKVFLFCRKNQSG